MNQVHRWLLLVLVLAQPWAAGAQVPLREGVLGPIRPTPKRPEVSPPNLEAEKLRKQAEQFRLKGYDMTSKADELRDNNKDDAADSLDTRAELLFDRARSLERRADQIELSGGRNPERVLIPDL